MINSKHVPFLLGVPLRFGPFQCISLGGPDTPDPLGIDTKNLLISPVIGVARIFDWGWPKPQITCNDVIRNFRKKLFVEQRYRRIEDQKPWSGLLS